MRSKTVLVTGNAGFIGSHLCQKLIEKGYQVIGVDNFNDYYNPKQKETNIQSFAKNKSFKQYWLDILDFKGLKKVFAANQIDSIIHLAARAGVRPSLANPRLYHQVNVTGTKNLLELAKRFKVKRFIFASSSSVYGNQKKIPFSEGDQLLKPASPYASSKQAGEKLCQQYARKYGIQTTVLRFFTVYGPKGRPDMAPSLFTRKILQGKPITKYGDGTTKRDYTYIDDIIDGVMKAVEKPFTFEIINLGNNQPVTLNDFIDILEKLTGKKAKIVSRPRHPADVPLTYAEITKARKLLNWQPKTNLEIGMKKFIDWYKTKAAV